ncbi:flagellin [Kordiimonas lacus]|uniref:Flagellin n=1 Tax=Kordiimonas lacus TaxID=637679 RepID=A0A1G7BFG3_9PROT|nr:flagellin [Kordiimonas lacus]
MSFSVNTNAGAFVALQNLNKTSSRLDSVQGQINTGLKVSSAKDNAAVYAIAQKLRGDLAGFSAVQSSIDRAISTLDVSIAAAEAVSDLLIEMKEKAVAAKDPGVSDADRTVLNDDFVQLREQAKSIVENAEFNGTNAVKDGGDDIVAITDSTGDSTITITAQSLAFGVPPGAGPNIELSSDATISIVGNATTAVTEIDNSITNLNTVLSEFGAGVKRLELQKQFTTKLADSIEVGIGNLVDADMAKTSAELQSLQVKQQLGLQALSIANQAPSATLSLFR